jgi:hypothetical protein
MVVTTERDWGGWRVLGAEYDLDPYRIERQAEIIVRAPLFMKLLEEFVDMPTGEFERGPDQARADRAQDHQRTLELAHICAKIAGQDLAFRAPPSKSDGEGMIQVQCKTPPAKPSCSKITLRRPI